jgi:hypothetical protein
MIAWIKGAWKWLAVGFALVLAAIVAFIVVWYRGRVAGELKGEVEHEIEKSAEAAQRRYDEVENATNTEAKAIHDSLPDGDNRDRKYLEWVRSGQAERRKGERTK